MSAFYDALEHRDPEVRQRELVDRLAKQVAHAQAHTPYFAKHLAHIDPAQLTSAEAIAALPLTRKSDLHQIQRSSLPFGGLAAPDASSLRHLFASPGPIYEPDTDRPDFWRFARALHGAGFRPGDVIHNCFSYHFTPAGMMVETGAHALGCAVIPGGVGQTELQVQTIADLRPDGYAGTPSFLKIILEKGAEMDADLSSLSKALVSGEALPASLRTWFDERGVAVRQCYASADLGLIAYESEAQQGLIIDEGVYVEIVRPGAGRQLADGEVGEVVVTSLNPDYPLIRFATGDLSAILVGASPCGRTNRRLKGWMGRADQTAKIRGLFVHPPQIEQIAERHPDVLKIRLVIDRIDESDRMRLICESEKPSPDLAAALQQSARDILRLRAEIEFAGPGSLANDGKVIDDLRELG